MTLQLLLYLSGLAGLQSDKSDNTVINQETRAMVYKSLNDLAPEMLGNIFEILPDIHTRVVRNRECNIAIPKYSTTYDQKSFAFRGADSNHK